MADHRPRAHYSQIVHLSLLVSGALIGSPRLVFALCEENGDGEGRGN